MFSDPRSDFATSRTGRKKDRFSSVFSDKDKTHRSVSGIPFNLGAATSLAERYALRLGVITAGRETRSGLLPDAFCWGAARSVGAVPE